MNKKSLPSINSINALRPKSRIDEKILSRWNQNIKAAKEENNTITIYEVIGEDGWIGGGFTAKRMAAALRSIGKKKDVIVSINSPGGDFFEGAAIYNLLREHEGNVTVKIIGMAASAASVIAMAGDTIQISKIGFLMIHDVWGFVVGNRNDMREAADTFQKFDDALADVYAARSGYDRDEIVEMLDNDTWMNAKEAIEKGFADENLNDEDIAEDTNSDNGEKARALAKRAVEMSLARDGLSRKERDEILNKAFGARDAARNTVRDAGEEEQLESLLQSIKGG